LDYYREPQRICLPEVDTSVLQEEGRQSEGRAEQCGETEENVGGDMELLEHDQHGKLPNISIVSEITVPWSVDSKSFVVILNNNFEALLDTGAARTCIEWDTVQRMNINWDSIDWDTKIELYTVSGEKMNVVGTILLVVEVQILSIPYEFVIVDGLSDEVILGRDFLRCTSADMRNGAGTVTFYSNLLV